MSLESNVVDLKTMIYIILGLVTIGGAIVSFFSMQTRQNMKISQLEQDLANLKRRQDETDIDQRSMDKTLALIGEKLDRLLKDMDELKERRSDSRPRNNISQGG